jgi:hypothetical protein
MPGSASNYLENKLIDHSLGTTTFTKPTTVYAALYTAAPSDTGGGTEVTGGSYARQTITFSAASSGSASNNTNVDFNTMPAATVVAVAVLDASTAGNVLFWGTLATNRTVTAGDSIRIASGALVISLD